MNPAILAPLLAACLAAPPENQPPLELSLASIGVTASINVRAPSPNFSHYTQRLIRLEFNVLSRDPRAVAILGHPRILEATADDGADLTQALGLQPDPRPLTIPTLAAARRPGEPLAVRFGVTFDGMAGLPRRIDRAILEVDVAVEGDSLDFGLSPTPNPQFTTLLPGVEARVAATGIVRDGQRYITVEYRIDEPDGAPFAAIPDESEWIEIQPDPAFADRPERLRLMASARTTLVAGLRCTDERGQAIGRIGTGHEIRTDRGRIGIIWAWAPEADVVAARLTLSTDSLIRRYRVEANNIVLFPE